MHHPWLCGFLLALVLVLAQVLTAPVDLLSAVNDAVSVLGGDSPAKGPLLLAAAVAAGALIASLPNRLRRRERHNRSTVRGCAARFAGGLLTALGCSIAGGDVAYLLLNGSFNGTVSGLAFALIVWLSGSIAAAVTGGGRA